MNTMKIYTNPNKLTPEQYAIYRHVWTLGDDDRNKLDKYFIMSSTGFELENRITLDDEDREYIRYLGINWEVEYIRDKNLSRHDWRPVLISFRYSQQYKIAIVLVKLITLEERVNSVRQFAILGE